MNPYSNGLIIGRFQVLHLGHCNMIRTALNVCDKVSIFIGSAQESNTQKNPFSYTVRQKMIENVFSLEVINGRLKIMPLNDIGVGNTPEWGDYVLKTLQYNLEPVPQLMISGKEDRRTSWFRDDIAELFVPKIVDVSATQMREFMLQDNFEEWQKYTHGALHDMYPILRALLIAAQKNEKTDSM